MAKKLNTTVHVHLIDAETGAITETVIVGPGDKLSPEVQKVLEKNPRVWEDDEDEQERPGPSETAAAGRAVRAAHRRSSGD